jgi:hypothetical protein
MRTLRTICALHVFPFKPRRFAFGVAAIGLPWTQRMVSFGPAWTLWPSMFPALFMTGMNSNVVTVATIGTRAPILN